jgi:hypothetical protein
MLGGVLLSHTLSSAVPSALVGLASGFGMGPGVSPPLWPPKLYETISTPQQQAVVAWLVFQSCIVDAKARLIVCELSPRPISTSQLHTLLCFHLWPINPVVYLGALTHKGVGDLILEQASRLDAFSGYPSRT